MNTHFKKTFQITVLRIMDTKKKKNKNSKNRKYNKKKQDSDKK